MSGEKGSAMFMVLVIISAVFVMVWGMAPVSLDQAVLTKAHADYAGLYGYAADGAAYALREINAELPVLCEGILEDAEGELDGDGIEALRAEVYAVLGGAEGSLAYEVKSGDVSVVVNAKWDYTKSEVRVTAERGAGGSSYTVNLDAGLVLDYNEIDGFGWEMINLKKNEGA